MTVVEAVDATTLEVCASAFEGLDMAGNFLIVYLLRIADIGISLLVAAYWEVKFESWCPSALEPVTPESCCCLSCGSAPSAGAEAVV